VRKGWKGGGIERRNEKEGTGQSEGKRGAGGGERKEGRWGGREEETEGRREGGGTFFIPVKVIVSPFI
jgi:hypothetical protein